MIISNTEIIPKSELFIRLFVLDPACNATIDPKTENADCGSQCKHDRTHQVVSLCDQVSACRGCDHRWNTCNYGDQQKLGKADRCQANEVGEQILRRSRNEKQKKDHPLELFFVLYKREVLYSFGIEEDLNEARADAPKEMQCLQSERVTYKAQVQGDALQALFAMTPYFYRTSKAGVARLQSTPSLLVDVDVEISVYQK